MNEKPNPLLIPPPSARLKTWRLGKGLTQRQVASLLGVPTNTVSRWEQEARALRGLYRRAVEELIADRPLGNKHDPEAAKQAVEALWAEARRSLKEKEPKE